MAILLLGQSRCPLCGCLLLATEHTTALPAICDTAHPLYAYFDTGFHQRCFAQWPHRAEAQALVLLERERYQASAEYQQLLTTFGKPKGDTDS
jgi:hypothetical protein